MPKDSKIAPAKNTLNITQLKRLNQIVVSGAGALSRGGALLTQSPTQAQSPTPGLMAFYFRPIKQTIKLKEINHDQSVCYQKDLQFPYVIVSQMLAGMGL